MRAPTLDVVERGLVKLLRRFRSVPSRSIAANIADEVRAWDATVVIVRAFYGISLVWVIQDMGSWLNLRDVAAIDPLWPAGWVDQASPRGGISAILLLYGTSAVLAALWPTFRTFRALYFVGLFQYLSIKWGFGKINHNYHGWLWTAGLFVLLPTRSRVDSADGFTRRRGLAVLWSAQVMVLFFYTLTGLWKLAYALHALTSSRVSSFELDAFSLIVGDRILATDQQTLLGEFFVRNELIGWALFNGTMYLETAALLAVLRPRLHRLWGGGLILFHMGTQLAMGFTFIQNVALLALLLMASPAAPSQASLREIVSDLPGVHVFVRRRKARTVAAT